MRRTKLACLALAAALALVSGGCGSNRDSGGSTSGAGGIEAAETIGVDNCLTCHLGGVGTPWLAGVHGNPDEEPLPSLADPSCLACHDALGDGQILARATSGAESDRPVIGCESCHGGGQFHLGVGPLPYPVPDADRCGQCHNESFPHGFAPEGAGIVEAFTDSPHTRSLNEFVFVDETDDVRARCSKCHSDEGAKLYRDTDGGFAELTSALPNDAEPLADASPIDCRTCHRAHDEGRLLEEGSAGRSAEFNTCTNCHQLLDEAGDKIIAYHDPAANPFGDEVEIITDTHFAEPGNYPGGASRGVNQNDIAGYAMDFSDDRVCRDCHNPHNADTTINEEWAQSKHAEKAAAAAWAHYNWTEVEGAVRNDGSDASDRTECQRCHTTTAVIAYLAANEDGDASDYVAPLAYDPDFRPEMLKCNGCHTTNLGELRGTGIITADYTNAPFVYPDALASNLCLACHTGRESGESVTNCTFDDDDDEGTPEVPCDFTDTGFINSHYLTAGGTVYTATGYEYDVDDDAATDDYENPSFYAHDQIGMGTDSRLADFEAANGTNGPCIGCHLSSEESHLFEPVERDGTTGLIAEVTSSVCVSCHAGDFVLTPEELEEEEEGIAAALEALAEKLEAEGHPFLGRYPYFSAGDWTSAWDAAGKDTMGAAFNYNLLVHDPGAYAHNRFYAKRLIFDSLDFLGDGLLDNTVEAAIDALVASSDLDAAVADLAKAYLDGSSSTAGMQRP